MALYSIKKLYQICFLLPLFFVSSQLFAATITSNASSGFWDLTSSWSGGVVPGINDDVVISGGNNITLRGNVTVKSISFGTNSSSNAAQLTVNTGFTLTVTTSLTVINSTSNKNIPAVITGQVAGTSGTIICASLSVGGTNTLITSSQTTTLTSTVGNLQVTGDVNVNGVGISVLGIGYTNTAIFTQNSGIVTVGGAINVNGGLLGGAANFNLSSGTLNASGVISANSVATGGAATFDMTQGSKNATLNVSSTNVSSPFSSQNGGTFKFSNSSSTTVNYTALGNQQVYAATYDNLTLSGSGAKALPTGLTTINKAFTLAGTASATATVGLTVAGDVVLGSGTTFNAGSFTHNVGGNWTNNGTNFTAGTSTINLNNGSASPVAIGGSAATAFNLLTVNKSSSSYVVNNSVAAFSANGVTVTKGNLTLSATNTDYNINGNLSVSVGSTTGTLTHSVDYDATGKSLVVTGNVAVDGFFKYAGKSRVLLSTPGSTVRSGTNPTSAFRILALANSSGTISASGKITVDDWLLVGNDVAGGTFNTNSQLISGNAMYISGGTVNANSAITLSSSLTVGNNSTGINNLAGTFNLQNGGSLTANAITLAEAGNASPAGTLNQASGTTINVLNSDFTINASGVYNATGNALLNLKGDWDNSGTYSAGTGTVTFNGTVYQELRSAATTVFYNVKNTNASPAGVAFTTDVTDISISNNLEFASASNGKIITNSNTLFITAANPGAAITGASSSRYIVGNLSFAYPAGNTANLVYPIGTSASYIPATLSLNGVSGDFAVTASVSGTSANEDNPTINSSGVSLTNRAPAYWTLSQAGSGSFTSYSSKFDFSNLAAGGTPANYKLRNFTAAWADIASPVNASNTTTGNNLTNFGEFVAGEANSLLAAPPTDYNICVGDNALFSSGSNSLPAPSVKWQRSVDGVAPFVDVTSNLDAATTYSGFNSDNLALSAPGNTLNNYVYRAVYSNINGSTNSATARLVFTTRPTSVLSGNQTACSGAPSTLTVVLTGTSPWSITYSDGTTPATITGITTSPFTFNVNPVSTSTYTITALSDKNCTGTSRTGSAKITIIPAPVFSQQPTANTTICETGSASFTVAATGNGTITYAWKKNGNALSNTGNISGVNTATLNITNAVTGDGAVYTCVATDACGVSTTSNNATLVVNANASTANAGPNQTGTATCGTAILAANTPAVGNGLWTITSGTGGSFSNTANPGATFTGTPGNTYVLRWTVSNSSNSCNTNFSEVTIALNPYPAVTNSNTLNICSGSNSSITLAATVPSTFSWTIGAVSGVTGATPGSGGTINLAGLSNTSGAPGTVEYNVTPTSTASGCVGSVYKITVTVNPIPAVNNATTSTCSAVAFNVTPTGTGITAATRYTWPAPVVTGGITGGSLASNQTAISQTLTNPTSSNQTATYTITPSINGCNGAPFTATVTVNPTPTVSATNNSQIVCSGVGITNIVISNPNAVSGTTFSWTRTNTTNLTGIAASGTGTTISGVLTNVTNTQQQSVFTIVATAGTCSSTSTTATITVNPQPTVAVSASQAICSGNTITAINITNPNSVSGTTFSWTRDNTTNTTGIAASGTGTPVSGTLTNTQVTVQTTTFTVTATAGTCNSATATSVVTVNPTPVVSITNNTQTVCSGTAFTAMTISSTVPSSTFTWSRNNTTNVTGTSSGNTSTIAAVALANVTNTQQITTYTAIATAPAGAGSCTGNATANITVNPRPLIGNQTLTTCSGSPISFVPVNNAPTTIVPSNTTYTWIISTNNTNITGQVAQASGQTSFSQTLSNATASNQNITYTVTPTAPSPGSCAGSTFTVTVTVYPAATVNAVSNATYCGGAAGSAITFGSNLAGATYAWTSTSDVGFGTSGTGNIAAFTATNATTSAVTATVSVRATFNGCQGAARTFTVTVNPRAVPNLVTNYCYGGGVISLTPTLTPNVPGVTYLWNTGGTRNQFTTDSLFVDIASTYYVTVTSPGNCVATDTAIVSEELVSNGNFELGNTGFITEYGYATGANSLIPEGLYSVGTNAQSFHPNFWGNDHTTGSGQYMIVNGAPTNTGNTFTVIWQQPTITVRANTNYYFAAWARSLNNVAPFAKLQFRVNGQQVGTIDSLVSQPNAGPYVWSRFYGTWNSGSSTTAVVSITDLEQNRNGNDFGLDDISFGTLAAVPFTVAATNSVGGIGCTGKSITLNTTVTSGLSPFTYQWTGPNSFSASSSSALVTNTSALNAGKYIITVRDKYGCPIKDSTTISINPQSTITGPTTGGTDNQSVCINNPIANIVYSTTNATSATLTGLPANITGNYSSGTFTISGTPATDGTFAYKVKTTAICPDSVSGNLQVRPNATLVLSSGNASPAAFCVGTSLAVNIVYTAGGAANNVTASGLPAGMSGVYNSGANTFTISGVPTVAGSFPFTVTASGSSCINQQLSGTITVTDNGNIAISSGTASPTLCVNTPLTSIVYTISGTGTGASLTSGSYPTGVSGAYNAGTKQYTISGTPSVSGSFPYTITASGSGCTNKSVSGTITVNPDGTLTLTSLASTSNQTICITNGITNITYQRGGNTTGISVAGLPTGLTTNVSGTTLTISGTPTQTGTFNYTVSTSGSPCVNPALGGTITVNANATLAISTGSATQTVCINNSIGAITYAVGGAGTGATVTGLPAGVTGLYSGGNVTISGAPTASGTFNFTVTTTGSSCVNPSLSGIITVNPDATITLTTANASQTVCISNPIAAIKYTVGGNGTSATVTGLPSGLTTGFSAGVFTISGSPTASGTFNYTVSTTGSGCINPSLGGTITVNPNATLTTSGLTAETKCVLSAFTARTYNVTNATGVTLTGSLPPGVSGGYNGTNNTYTISGASTSGAVGVYSYTLTTTGDACQQATASGTYTVNIVSTISRIGNTPIQACVGSPVSMQFQLGGGATGATVTGSLPPNVTGSYNSTTKIYTVSGTPLTQGGTGASTSYAFTVTATGSVCGTPTATGTITLSSNHTLSRTSAAATTNQTLCEGVAITPITYTFGGGATGANVSGLPPGVSRVVVGNNVTISGTPTATGTFNYTLTTTGSCATQNATGTIRITPNSSLDLVSDISTTSQKVCINTGIIDIEYQFGGAAGNLTITGLPAGVSYEINGSSIRIFGSPSVGGVFSYTIKNVGTCSQTTTTGSITIPNSTPGLWTGAADNDWFNCANWASGTVPDQSIDVVIPNNAPVKTIIDPNSIYAPNFSGIATAKNISVGSNLEFTDGAELDVSGNVTITSNGSVNMTQGGLISLSGNWTDNAGANGLIEGTGTVAFTGNQAQNINSAETFNNLVVNQDPGSTGGLIIKSNVRVQNTLELDNGIVYTNAINNTGLGLLTLGANAAPVAGSPGIYAFVSGQLVKEFSSAQAVPYILPIGKDLATDLYKPVIIWPTDNSTLVNGSVSSYKAEYVPQSNTVDYLLGSVLGIVTNEYWQVDRSYTGTPINAKVGLYYVNPGSGSWSSPEGLVDPCDVCNVAVANYFNNSYWNFTKAGSFSTSQQYPEARYNTDQGWIYSDEINSFGRFTFGFGLGTVLDVKLISFEGKLQNQDGLLGWKVSGEKDLAGFVLEHSADGVRFSKLADIAASSSDTYSYTHQNLPAGNNYYRLQVKDRNGSNYYSKIVLIAVKSNATKIIRLLTTTVTNTVTPVIYSATSQTVRAQILDATGRLVGEYKGHLAAGNNQWPLDTNIPLPGMYFIAVKTEDGTTGTLRFFRQ